MQITSQQKQEIIGMLHNGYSIDSISKVMSKKYKKQNFAKSDILIISKQIGIKNIGKKDIKKQSLDVKTAEKMVSKVLNDKNSTNKLTSKLIILLISFIALLGVIWYFISFKIMLITCIVIVSILFILSMFVYFKFIRKSDKIKKEIRNTKKK